MSPKALRLVVIGYILITLAAMITAPRPSDDALRLGAAALRQSGVLSIGIAAFSAAALGFLFWVFGIYGLLRFRGYGPRLFVSSVLLYLIAGAAFGAMATSDSLKELLMAFPREPWIQLLLVEIRTLLEGFIVGVVYFSGIRVRYVYGKAPDQAPV